MPAEMRERSQELIERRKRVRAQQRNDRKEKAAQERAAKRLKTQTELCRRVALGQSLMAACSEDRAMPHYGTILDWLHDDADFANMYKNAQRARADVLFEQTLEIADDARNDWMQRNDPNNPGWVANGEHLARSKLRVDTRKWMVSKISPDRYGDKLELQGDPNRPVVVAVVHEIVNVVRPTSIEPPEPAPPPSRWDDPDLDEA